ncbi:CAP domain-containing protein [Streptomyces sp. NPDC018019]|uniref:CAP domain-containing protein n=1 Tax=Streptomyces sp. NPDC018019 TaxID=3365030 RepID=UPI0037891F09
MRTGRYSVRTGRYSVRAAVAVVAVLLLAGPVAGGPAVATPSGTRPALVSSGTRPALTASGVHSALPDAAQAALASYATHTARTPQAVTRAPGNAEATRAAVVRLVNRERAKAGCRPVRAHRTVTEAAQRHSGHMARADSLSHRERGGSGPGNRLSAVGYDWRRAGENIARGQLDAAEVVRAWARSPEHRVVLADCSFRHAGVGIDTGTGGRGPWWTLLLAAPA